MMASASPHSLDKLGMTVRTLTGDLAERFGIESPSGVVVTQVTPGSVADMAGIKTGAIIKEVNRKVIKNIGDFKRAIKETSKHQSVLMLIQQGNYSSYVTLKVE